MSQEAASVHLSELLEKVDASKRRIILQRMAMHLVPIMEKALVDPVLTHRQGFAPHLNLQACPSNSFSCNFCLRKMPGSGAVLITLNLHSDKPRMVKRHDLENNVCASQTPFDAIPVLPDCCV